MMRITDNFRAAHVMRIKAPPLAEAIVAEHYTLRPELEQRYGGEGRKRCLEDARFHLHFLAGSVEFGDPRVFADYTAWAVAMLARRRIPAEHVAENVRVMRRVLDERLPRAVAELGRPHLAAALRALAVTGDQSPGRLDALSQPP
jgi:hypothetical protein